MSVLLTSAEGYADTVAAGHVESPDDWAVRTLRPDDWAERLALAWCWSLVVTATHCAGLEARIAAERRASDRLVTYITSGMTGRHIAAGLATTAGLLLLGRFLWGTQ